MSLDNLIWGEILDGARIANEVCTATKIALKILCADQVKP